MRLGRRSLGFDRALLGGSDPLIGLEFDPIDRFGVALGSLALGGLDTGVNRALGVGLERGHFPGQRFAIGIRSLLRLLKGFLGTIAGLLGTARIRFGVLALAALGLDPHLAFLAELAHGRHRLRLQLSTQLLAASLSLGNALLADPHPLKRLLGRLMQLFACRPDRFQLRSRFAH